MTRIARRVALIQAGGRGERMERSLGVADKPLVPVRGVPLIERNLVQVIAAGLERIVVAVRSDRPALRAFIDERLVPVARALHASLEIFVEERPLGTIGAAAHLAATADTVLVVNADNLTALPLRDLLASHAAPWAASPTALTLAAHREPFRIPYGELVVEDGRVRAYREKPDLRPLVCSAISVLGVEALARLDPDSAASLPELTHLLLESGAVVRAFEHQAPWVDVNDAEALDRAEQLVADHRDLFEQFARPPDGEVVGALLHSGDDLLLERRPPTARLHPGRLDTPGGKVEPGEAPGAALVRELREELGLRVVAGSELTCFDAIDCASGSVLRHHVFSVAVTRAEPEPRGIAVEWVALGELGARSDVDPIVLRSVAAWRPRRRAGGPPGPAAR